eukprot:TCONS_00027022-protein
MCVLHKKFKIFRNELADLCSGKLNDNVIDAYMNCLELEANKSTKTKKENRIMIFETPYITRIVQRQNKICMKRKKQLLECEMALGIYNKTGDHWCLLVILPPKKTLYAINPLGCDQSFIEERWRKIMQANDIAGEWKVEKQEHARQNDVISCGVFCLKVRIYICLLHEFHEKINI